MSRVTSSPQASVTWFIDPPYNNAAGKKYATSSVNYTHLAAWCRSRHGQTIVRGKTSEPTDCRSRR
jgi:hypothetical protein